MPNIIKEVQRKCSTGNHIILKQGKQTQAPVTLAIIIINALVFLASAWVVGGLSFQNAAGQYFMLHAGANFNPYTVGGQYWRLLTSMFMHWDIVHIAVNMFALHGVGRALEPFLGGWRFALLYLATGLAAGLASLQFNMYVLSAGASGAIFGLFGYLVIWQILINFRDRALLKRLLINFLVFVVVNTAIAKAANVDTPAHLGGFVAGAVLAVLNYFSWLTKPLHFLLVLVVLGSIVGVMPQHKREYYQIYQQVMHFENVLQRTGRQLLTEEQRHDSLTTLVPVLDTVQARFDRMTYIDKPLRPDTAFMRQYVALRQQELQYRLKEAEDESFVYRDSIEMVQQKMNALGTLQYPLAFERMGMQESEDDSNIDEPAAPIAAAPTVVYYDSAWRELPDSSESAAYYRQGQRDTLGRWQGTVQDYFLDGAIQMRGAYLNDKHHGVFRYYRKNGTYESLGRYRQDRAVGKWENYYPNGQLHSEVYYGDRTYTKSVYDSLGNQQVTNGDGKEITKYANGQIQEEGAYEEGLRQGYWYGYHPSDKPYYQELYRDNLLVHGEAHTEDGQRFVYDQLSVFPFPEMGMEAYRQYLLENIRRPEELGQQHGTVELTFLVDIDGEVRDFVVDESLCIPCDEEAIRLVKEGPPWRPGVLRGHKKIRSNGYLHVEF